MKNWLIDNFRQMEGTYSKDLRDRYEVHVRFVIKGHSPEDAAADLKCLIQEGIIRMLDEEDREIIEEFDVEDAVPAELL
jgi:hypothetical protein